MKIYSALQIGEYHINHCEDYLFIDQLEKDKLLCAVMDGCTMGTDSYLASTLIGKLLRKIVKSINYKALYVPQSAEETLETTLKSILAELFRELAVIKNQLLLNHDELLTTLILLLVDKKSGEGMVFVIGDGLVAVNGHITDYDQNNKPDYIGFHLGKNFEEWYASQTQRIYFEHLEDVAIATDGIGLFTKITDQKAAMVEPVDFLLRDKEDCQKDDMLEIKLKKLEHQFGVKPGDDLAIIRIINNNDIIA